MIINNVTSIAQEIYEEMGEPDDFSIAAIAAWVRRNIGGLGNMLNNSYEINSSTLEISPNLSDIEKYIFKKMYTSIKDDFGSVQKLNTNEILKGFYQIRQQEYKELKDLSTKYVLNASSPVQVAGDDTIPGSYDSEKGALYNIRTIYNAG